MEIADLTFRAGLPQDASLIRSFVRATYAKWVPVMGREPLPMVADYDLALAQHLFLLAFAGDDLAGLIEMVPEPDHVWVENIAVRSDVQGQGLGRHLLDLACTEARRLGLAEVRLLTNAALTSNIRFYQSYGFRLDATEPFRGGHVVRFSLSV